MANSIIIENYTQNLKFQNGFWQIPELDKISYPSDGNNLCFDIEGQSFWFKNRNRIIFEIINKYSISGPIFDVGGGNGFVANYLCNNGFETILVEPGIDGCINGKVRGLKYIINSFFDTTHFFANSIPNVGIFDVMEHVENHDNFLDTLNNLLISNGRLFITVPAFYSLWAEEDNYAGHYRRYRIKELQKLITGHGFDILYSTYFFSFLFFPVFILRTIPSKIGFYKPDPEKSKNQHFSTSTTNAFLDAFMKFELGKIRKGKSLKYGSSLLLVAKKR